MRLDGWRRRSRRGWKGETEKMRGEKNMREDRQRRERRWYGKRRWAEA